MSNKNKNSLKVTLPKGVTFKFKLKNNSFRNLISKEDLNKFDTEEKQQFYVKNNVYIKSTTKYAESYISKLIEEDRYFIRTHNLNPDLSKEIIEYYLEGKEAFWENDYLKEKIIIKINNALNEKHKSEIIKSEYNKYFKKLHKNKLSYWYFLDDDTLKELLYENFIDFIKSELHNKTNIIDEFITELFPNFWSFDMFQNWSKIEKYKGILDFLKNYEKEKLSGISENSIANNNKPTTNNENYFSRVFPSKIAENYLFKILDEYNVLKKDGTIDKGYQKYCDSFWRIGSSKKYKNVIFKLNAKKTNYLEYLNKKYKANISETFKGKLTDGSKYDDDIIKLIDIYIKE